MEGISKLIDGISISEPAHADAILELAFLMSAVDGVLADEELSAFRSLVGKLRGDISPSQKDVNDLIERFVLSASQHGVEERTRQVAALIPEAHRGTAFRIIVLMSRIDNDKSEWEDEMIVNVAKLLGVEKPS